MNISMLRAGSRGLEGTYENINCHAKGAKPTVNRLVDLVGCHQDRIENWKQAHNVHVLIAKNGRMLAFRPFRPAPKAPISGVEVYIKISRANEIPLMPITDMASFTTFAAFFDKFLDSYTNCYALSEPKQ